MVAPTARTSVVHVKIRKNAAGFLLRRKQFVLSDNRYLEYVQRERSPAGRQS